MRAFSLATLFVLAFHARSVDAGNRRGVFVAQAPSSTCAPVTTVDDPSFTLAAYAVHPWYVQQQMTVRYQPEDTLYCVRASYTLEPDGSVSVLNTANRGAVDGARQNPTLTRLRAVVADPRATSHPPSSWSALVSSPGSRTGPTGSSPRPRSSPGLLATPRAKATTGPSCPAVNPTYRATRRGRASPERGRTTRGCGSSRATPWRAGRLSTPRGRRLGREDSTSRCSRTSRTRGASTRTKRDARGEMRPFDARLRRARRRRRANTRK